MSWSVAMARRQRSGFAEPSRDRCSSTCWSGCLSCHDRHKSGQRPRKGLLHGRKGGRIHDRSRDLRTGTVKHVLPGHGLRGYLAFSPDGQTLAAATATNIVRLWDVQTGQPRQQLSAKEGGWNKVAFSPDGK